MTSPKAYVFDAYGTLFDVHSVIEAARSITSDPETLSTLWRQKQLEYTWLRSLMGRYDDFWSVTEHALRFALGRLRIHAAPHEISMLMGAYLTLTCFPEVPGTIERLSGKPLGILSNGAPRMLDAVVRANGLEGRIAHVISVDAVKIYKPSPRVYELAARAFGLAPRDILFVSSNAWDVAGAKAFGYPTCWCNRQKAPMEVLGFNSDYEVERLDQLEV